jgi:hypothetical protein
MRQLYWTWPSARAEVEEAARLFEVSKDAIPASCSDHWRSCRLLRLLCGADTSAGCLHDKRGRRLFTRYTKHVGPLSLVNGWLSGWC